MVYKKPFNVKAIASTLERPERSAVHSECEPSPGDGHGLVKSRSFNDIHMVEDDWVSLDPQLLKKLPPMPSPPPKPPARRKRMQGSIDEGVRAKAEKKVSPSSLQSDEVRSDGSSLLKPDGVKRDTPSPEERRRGSPKLPKVPLLPNPVGKNTAPTTESPKPPARSKAAQIPPRPPPPFTKPTQRTVKVVPTPKVPVLPNVEQGRTAALLEAVKKASLEKQSSETGEDRRKPTFENAGGLVTMEHMCKIEIECLFN